MISNMSKNQSATRKSPPSKNQSNHESTLQESQPTLSKQTLPNQSLSKQTLPKQPLFFAPQKTSKEPTFFCGKNIFETLKNSLFGRINDIIKNLIKNNVEELQQYKLPKVVVIGNESTGKSSLLENITKCQLFPRHHKLCTKAPIHLILNNGAPKYVIKYINPEQNINIDTELLEKKEIFIKVNEIMNLLPTDNISEHEIIIEMTDHDLPRFDFFDLPGIRTYPPKMAEMTTNICRKYLSGKDSIVLCVVPANVTRLTSCQSIALVTEMNMEHNCILALTMADRLQEENVEDLLINRILKTSDEMQNLNFAGCISVVNRLHTDQFTLAENDNIECKWFHDNIIRHIPAQYTDQKVKIIKNTTVSNLLQKMDELYNKFIHEDWKPRITEKIINDTNKIQNEINDLGQETISNTQINQLLKEFINSKIIPEIVVNSITISPKNQFHLKTAQFNAYYESQNLLTSIFKNNTHDNETLNNITSRIENIFFGKNEFNTTLKIYRFDDAKDEIRSRICVTYDDLIKQSKIHVMTATKNYLDFVYMNGIEFTPDLIKTKYIEMFDLLILNKLLTQFDFIDLSTPKMFTENKSSKLARQNMNKRIQILKNYMDTINNI